MKTLADITGRDDVENLVHSFYRKVNEDSVLSPFFNDVAHIDWEKHLPRMVDFWENVLFGTGKYDGNPMLVHRQLHQKKALHHSDFEHWVNLFVTTVDELYAGEKAERIKQRARGIATLMEIRVTAPDKL